MKKLYKTFVWLNLFLILYFIFDINIIRASSGSGDVVNIESPININSPTELASTIIRANVTIIGLVAVAAMIYAGILYFTSGGNEEQAGKAKKTITYAILGLVITILSYVIINTLINAIGG